MRAQGLKTQNQLVAPSVNGRWTVEEVIGTGLLADFANEIGILSVEKYVGAESTHGSSLTPRTRYPSDNCAAAFNTGMAFTDYLQALQLTGMDFRCRGPQA